MSMLIRSTWCVRLALEGMFMGSIGLHGRVRVVLPLAVVRGPGPA